MENNQQQITPIKTLFVFVPNRKYYEKFLEYSYYIDLLCSDHIKLAETQQFTNENCQPLFIRHIEFQSLELFRATSNNTNIEVYKSDSIKFEKVIFIQYNYDRIFQKPDMAKILEISDYIIASPIDTPEMTTMVIKKRLDKAWKKHNHRKNGKL